ncbi:DUF4136 domain-containing protein [Thalassotalea aquiviva]|uniref:DUF4136 domain-containing protein n=1 Tax=Thalassotalea aquiviva TaxID=3242415 RepID=UPI00352A5095
MIRIFFCLPIFALVYLVGCASPAPVHIQDHNFNSIKTYSLFARASKFNEIQALSDYQRNRIELAIERTMEEKNYAYAPVANADVIVSYFLVRDSTEDFIKYNKLVQACLGCSKQKLAKQHHKIKPQTLVLDVLDNDSQRSVYRSYTSLKTELKNTSDENQQIIMQAVDKMLMNFPLGKSQ